MTLKYGTHFLLLDAIKNEKSVKSIQLDTLESTTTPEPALNYRFLILLSIPY